MTDQGAAEQVLAFWLETVGPKGWYETNPDVDAEITRRFGPLCEAAAAGELSEWEAAPRPALALVILLDQFPRNMFRGTAQAFATDPLAHAAAERAIAAGHDLATPEPERQFFYLPLMHAEDLAAQERCCALIAERLPETGSNNIDHAEKHADIIRRFGRFPSRNAALGRTDTEAELAYRAAGGYMSG